MAIKWLEDLGAPALVAVADIAIDAQKPTWSRPVGIGMAAAGYILGGVMGMGGQFMKNLGIAAAPWAFESIYNYVKEATPISSPASKSNLAMRPAGKAAGGISRYPAPARDVEFQGVTLD